MLIVLKKTLLIGSSVLGFCALVMAGCSSDEDTNTGNQLDSGPFCPATLRSALDPAIKCIGEGFECPIGYTCGANDQQAYCKCEGGKFTCKSGRGEPIDNADTPPCAKPGTGADKECPQSQAGTEGTTCKTPGLQCFYRGFTCPEDPTLTKTDVCQCIGQPLPDGGPTLQFRCEIDYCNPKSDASFSFPDAGSGGG